VNTVFLWRKTEGKLTGLRVPLAVRVPQFGNHCSRCWSRSQKN